MVFLHRWKFFSNKGNNLNLSKIPKINVEVDDVTGTGAKFLPITDHNNNLVFIEIISTGASYTAPTITITDDNGSSYIIPSGSITLGTDQEITAITLGAPDSGVWSYPSFTYEADLFFNERIPTDLIENEHIFIVEETKSPVAPNPKGYVFPKHNTANADIRWKWSDEVTDDGDKDALFLFNVDTSSSLTPYIEKSDYVDITLANGSSDPTTTGKGLWRSILDSNDNAAQINIGLSYPSEGVFERKLQLFDYSDSSNPAMLAEIFVSGEVIPEDERFKTLLDNLGQKINAEEEFIFRDSDINEPIPNAKLLNEKRKEFVLEHSNITSYIGSYKAIFNVLNWLGYSDLRMKEYWMNIAEGSPNYKKYKPAEIPFDINQKGGDYESAALLPSTKYKKTNLFGLYYDINRKSGEVDDYGIPITEDAFMFTNEEVLIKLFALKKYLKDKFLPLNARIIDIVGEGIYFERYRVNSWSDGTQIFDIKLNRDADFTCDPKTSTIIDLRKLEDYDYFQPANLACVVDSASKQLLSIVILDPGYGYVGDVNVKLVGGTPLEHATATATLNEQGGLDSISIVTNGSGYASAPIAYITPEPSNPDHASTNVSEISNRLLNSFDRINDNTKFPDKPGIAVGAPIKLSTTSFDITWDELEYPWDDFQFDFKPAIVKAIIIGGVITGFDIIDSGEGYQSIPVVNVVGGSPSTLATATAVITAGKLTGFNITNTGAGYIGVPTIDLVGGVPVSQLNTWDTIGVGDFYEMQWIIKGRAPNLFEYRKRGRVDELREHNVIIPYVGIYDVELILYDTDNNWTNEIKNGCFEVKLPEINFTTFTRFTECKYTWDEMDMTWDEANFSWINPVRHNTTWDDMDLTWDDLDMISYVDQDVNIFPAINEKDLLRLSETDRYLGNLTNINLSTNELTISGPSVQPPVESGDFIYVRLDDNVFRTQIVSAYFDYDLGSINIANGGSYTIQRNFSSGVGSCAGNWAPETVGERPIAIISPPISGTQAAANPILNGSLILATPAAINQGYKFVEGGGLAVSLPHFPISQMKFLVVFTDPESPGTTAQGNAIFDSNGTFIQWEGGGAVPNISAGSGYNSPPSGYRIFDANLNVVTNVPASTPKDLFFDITIKGPISGFEILDTGSGYLSPPSVTVYPNVSGYPGLSNANISTSLNNIASSGAVKVNSLPKSITPQWDVLREIGRTILIPGDCVYDEVTNLQGLQVGDWLKLRGEDNVPRIKQIPILDDTFDNIGIISGIKVAGDVSSYKPREKCSIYRMRNLLQGFTSDKFEIDSTNKTITIVSPSFDPSLEILPGFHEIVLTSINSSLPGNPVRYKQRLLVEHINKVGNDWIINVIEIDGNLTHHILDNLSTMEYKFYEFPAMIDEVVFNNPNSSIVLNFNDWPPHDTFNPTANSWYMDYGIVSGDWALLVTDIGFEGNNTLVTLDDPNSELWQSSASFKVGWRKFDEDYAERRIGTNNLTWDNMDEVTWDDMCHMTWDMLEYKNYTYCGFRINKVMPGSRIQWNEESVFEFKGITGGMTDTQKFNQAVIELNATDNPGLGRFQYVAMPDSTTPTYIKAVSNFPGGDSLGYIRFTNGSEGEYSADPTLSHTFPLNNTDNPLWQSGYYGPQNKPANWDPTIRAYNEYGVDPLGNIGWYPSEKLPALLDSNKDKWKSERIPYLHALGGPLNWSEIMVTSRNSEVPTYSTMFFTSSNCKIAGKTNFLWIITDAKTGVILVESIKPYLIWTFTYEGEFNVELSVVDTNGNEKSKVRKGFVKTYKPSNKIK